MQQKYRVIHFKGSSDTSPALCGFIYKRQPIQDAEGFASSLEFFLEQDYYLEDIYGKQIPYIRCEKCTNNPIIQMELLKRIGRDNND